MPGRSRGPCRCAHCPRAAQHSKAQERGARHTNAQQGTSRQRRKAAAASKAAPQYPADRISTPATFAAMQIQMHLVRYLNTLSGVAAASGPAATKGSFVGRNLVMPPTAVATPPCLPPAMLATADCKQQARYHTARSCRSRALPCRGTCHERIAGQDLLTPTELLRVYQKER